MITKEEGKNQLKHLVKRFSDNLEQYKQPDYKEHHVRSEFIDGFFKSFGWDVDKINGHNIKEIYTNLMKVTKNKPRCIIANTVKGKGVSFAENNNEWHHAVLTSRLYETAINEINNYDH